MKLFTMLLLAVFLTACGKKEDANAPPWSCQRVKIIDVRQEGDKTFTLMESANGVRIRRDGYFGVVGDTFNLC